MQSQIYPPTSSTIQPQASLHTLTSGERRGFKAYIDELLGRLAQEPNPYLQSNTRAALQSVLDSLRMYSTRDRLTLKNIFRRRADKVQGPVKIVIDIIWSDYEAMSKKLRERQQIPTYHRTGLVPIPSLNPTPPASFTGRITTEFLEGTFLNLRTREGIRISRRAFLNFITEAEHRVNKTNSHEYTRGHYQRKFQDFPQLNIGYDNPGTWNATPYLIYFLPARAKGVGKQGQGSWQASGDESLKMHADDTVMSTNAAEFDSFGPAFLLRGRKRP
ncbi:hypothetical protein R3P38DRAFT_2813693 [Favolaschia claudopus]|uniref:Uncharacterized protein n=1 Tax=Favolaschia claudopus TaxID=2862362 RepID=A0AAV9Z583_9AGAR